MTMTCSKPICSGCFLSFRNGCTWSRPYNYTPSASHCVRRSGTERLAMNTTRTSRRHRKIRSELMETYTRFFAPDVTSYVGRSICYRTWIFGRISHLVHVKDRTLTGPGVGRRLCSGRSSVCHAGEFYENDIPAWDFTGTRIRVAKLPVVRPARLHVLPVRVSGPCPTIRLPGRPARRSILEELGDRSEQVILDNPGWCWSIMGRPALRRSFRKVYYADQNYSKWRSIRISLGGSQPARGNGPWNTVCAGWTPETSAATTSFLPDRTGDPERIRPECSITTSQSMLYNACATACSTEAIMRKPPNNGSAISSISPRSLFPEVSSASIAPPGLRT